MLSELPEVRLTAPSLLRDAAISAQGRLARVVLTALGTVLGVGSLVAVLGLADTARVQISDQFDVVRATEVTVTDRRPMDHGPPFPVDVASAVDQLAGVESGGLLWTAATAALVRPSGDVRPPVGLPVVAATPGAIHALRPSLSSGRLFEEESDQRGDHVAVLGASAAARLGFGEADGVAAVRVGGIAFTVVGIVEDLERRPQALTAVIVPAGTALELWGPAHGDEADPTVVLRTQPGAAQVAGDQVAAALRPDAPDRLRVDVPPDPATLRQRIDTDLRNLLMLLAGVSLAIGSIGIGNSMFVSVLGRTSELGLRRALGARPRDLASLIALEAGVVGAVGGVVGAWLGLMAVAGVSLAQGWRPVISPLLLAAAPVIGGVTGVVAGLAPAQRAATIEPLDALRR